MAKIGPFEKYHQKYENWFTHNRFAYESEVRAILNFIQPGENGIEIGIGSGLFAVPLGIKTGVDPSAEMRKIAKKRGLTVYDAVAEKLPFDSQKFDFALMVTTICFLDDILKSFEEAKRIIKDGGKFITAFVDRESPLGQEYLERKHENVFYRDAHFYSCDEVINILRQTGFQVDSVIQTIFGKLSEINKIQEYQNGHGKGGFVVIQAVK